MENLYFRVLHGSAEALRGNVQKYSSLPPFDCTFSIKHFCHNYIIKSDKCLLELQLELLGSLVDKVSGLSNKFVLSVFHRLSTRHYLHLLLSTGACSTAPAAIDRYLLHAERSSANQPHAAAAVDRWDRRTDARPLQGSCCTYYAGSVNRTLCVENM